MNKKHLIASLITLLFLGPFLVACSSAPEKQNIEIPPPPVSPSIAESKKTIIKKSAIPAVKTKAKKKTIKKTAVKKTVVKKPKKVVNKKAKPKAKTATKKTPNKTNSKSVVKQVTAKAKKAPTKEIALQPISKEAETTPEIIAPPILELTLAQLPLVLGEFWTLSRDEENICTLSHKKVTMSDGQGDTPVTFKVTADKLIFKTKSNIDLGYKDSGITIDAKPQHPIEALHNEYSIQYTKNYNALVTEMKTGQQLVLALGFWPTWPVTETYGATFDISNFNTAHDALTVCQKL